MGEAVECRTRRRSRPSGASRSLGSLDGGEDCGTPASGRRNACGWPFLHPGIIPGPISEGREPLGWTLRSRFFRYLRLTLQRGVMAWVNLRWQTRRCWAFAATCFLELTRRQGVALVQFRPASPSFLVRRKNLPEICPVPLGPLRASPAGNPRLFGSSYQDKLARFVDVACTEFVMADEEAHVN